MNAQGEHNDLLIRLPALVPLSALQYLWIDDFNVNVRSERGWAMVTAKTGTPGSRPWFALDRAELARVLFPGKGGVV